jgi:hypothetical protein
MAERFDDLAKILATRIPRRQAFRLFLGGVAASYVARGVGGGIAGWLLAPERAWAGPVLGLPPTPCRRGAPGVPCQTGGFACPDGFANCPGSNDCCPAPLFECCFVNGSYTCCNVTANQRCCGPTAAGNSVCCDLNLSRCCPDPQSENGFKCSPPARMQPNMLPPDGGGTRLRIAITSPGDLFIASVTTVWSENVSIDIPPISTGATSLSVIATKLDAGKRSRFELQTCLSCGAEPFCVTGDPALAELRIAADGRRTRDTFAQIAGTERFVTIRNGTPGVRRAQVFVNGRREAVRWLRDGIVRTIDLGEAMMPQGNIVTVVAEGRPGARVLAMITDTPFEEAENAAADRLSAGWDQAEPRPGENLHWGR